MKKIVFSFVHLLSFLSIRMLGPKVQVVGILSENTSSVTDVPINTPRLMSSVNTNNDFNSMLYLNQTKYAGWYYSTMQKQREPWYDQSMIKAFLKNHLEEYTFEYYNQKQMITNYTLISLTEAMFI